MIFQLDSTSRIGYIYRHGETVKSISSVTDLKGAKRTNKTLRGIITLCFKLNLFCSIEKSLLFCKNKRKFRLEFIQ